MYVSSTAPIPQNSMSPLPPGRAARYTMRKQITEISVARAASNYACAAPISSFSDFGFNLQNQVRRADDLLNRLNVGLTLPAAQAGASSTGTGPAPKVVPLNPVNTNPSPKPKVKPVGSWDAPQWGDAATAFPPICIPGQSSLIQAFQNHPGWALGGLVALLIAGGVIGTGVKRRRRAA